MKINRINWIVAGAAAAVVASYASCYIAADCTCAKVGQCYATAPLPDCSVPTCLIADTAASAWNVCSGPGPYTGREIEYNPVPCCPASCRAYDSCLHQYITMSGALCCAEATHYTGVGSGCQ